MHPAFYLANEQLPLSNWNQADLYTKRVFSWLCDLDLGRAYGIFCIGWGSEQLLNSIPPGYDTYVVTPGTEYVNWSWVNQLCRRFPGSQILLVSPYSTALQAESNLVQIAFDVWPYNLKFYFEEYPQPRIVLGNRKYKISSLANRMSQARSYICAYLHQTWPGTDYIMSWRKFLGKSEDLYLLNPTGNARVDSVIEYLKNHFFDLDIRPDGDFPNVPVINMYYSWSAYTDCVVNCTNESVNNSYQIVNNVGVISPGPYLTEKTYKALIAGSAVLPVGQYQTYSYLEQQGFQFDYPWNRDYDSVAQDIDRISGILDCLDVIADMDLEFLDQATVLSRQYNQDYVLSGDYYNTVNTINYQNIKNFSTGVR